MALVIDATVSGTASNSYVTLAEAELYFEARPFVTAWTALTTTQKNVLLAFACKMMGTYLLPYGYATEDTQALDYPRTDYVDCKGVEYDDDEIPQGIKDAQCEQALYLASTDPTTLPAVLSKGFVEAKADVLEVKLDKTFVAAMMCPAVIGILGCFGLLLPGSTGAYTQCYVDRR